MAIERVEAEGVDAEDVEGLVDDRRGESAISANLGVVACAHEQPVGHARRAAGATGDGGQRVVVGLERKALRRPVQDLREFFGGIELEVKLQAEAVAQRGGQHPRARGRADEGESVECEVDRTSAEPAFDGEVDAEVFHGRIDELLDHAGEAMDLVDEQDLARFHVGQEGHQVSLLDDGRAGRDAHVGPHFVRDHVGEGGFSQAGRSVEQDVLERFAALLGGVHRDDELLAQRLLSRHLGQTRGP